MRFSILIFTLILLWQAPIKGESKFFPGVVNAPSIDPAVPANFVAKAPLGTPKIGEWIYWGRQEMLEQYFLDPTMLEEPILRARSCTDKDLNSLRDAVKTLQITDYQESTFSWGNYPLTVVEGSHKGEKFRMAWLNLDDATETYWQFECLGPDKDLWEKFIYCTTPARQTPVTQNMRLGKTTLLFEGKEVEITAEQMVDTDAIQIVVQPHASSIKYRFRETTQGEYEGFPYIELNGTFEVQQDTTTTYEEPIRVIVQPVDKFTPLSVQPGCFIHRL